MRLLYFLSTILLVASCILYIQERPQIKMALQDMRTPHVFPDKLPVVRYLKSLGAGKCKSVVGVVDLAFDMDDQYFARLVHPGSARFATLDHQTKEQKRTNPQYNHGNIVARIINRILPNATFVCLRLLSHPEKELYSRVCAEDMHNMGVRIVVVSLEFYGRPWALGFSQRAIELGMIVVYAAANKRMPIEKLPAADEIIRLNSVGPGCALWVGSDIVPAMRHKISGYPATPGAAKWCFSAPGVNVDCGSGRHTGSSCAAPIVGAVLVLLSELFPHVTPHMLVEILREISRTPIGVTVPSIWYYTELAKERLCDMRVVDQQDGNIS